ncbi:MAG TPA: bifunctional rhamnulose-1-phosphate aldolase/short-chain dehydrogenase [Chitinophagaceae bacterium]|nr:bifunctional rhamnulose-1-phosphate aldolase/short-chain dehydrogenase [Chitinophagaceae bacterium]
MAAKDTGYQHVNWLWDPGKASRLGGDEEALLIYRSNLLGGDLRLTNYGGGNTSCKSFATDPVTGREVEVMWIKGSGGDLGTLTAKGLAALYLDRLRGLKQVYRGLEHEDAMVPLLGLCLFDQDSKTPSIDTPLHGLLPFRHIDHLHPDAAIAIAASRDGKQITRDLFEGRIGWVDWQRPGFDLGLKMEQCVQENPGLGGIILGSHGLFTWGDSSLNCYRNSLDVVERCASYIEKEGKQSKPVFGGIRIQPGTLQERRRKAAILLPVLRGLSGQGHRVVGHFSDDPIVLQFVGSADLERLAAMGTSCPDHFLRTKICPLVIPGIKEEDYDQTETLREKLSFSFQAYRETYASYYEENRDAGSPPMRDPNPVVVLLPSVGLFSLARDKQGARIAAEFYIHAIEVMKGAEAISAYTALSRPEAFRIEYWKLEEDKLMRMPKPKALEGRVALVTGSAGGIGKAIAHRFAAEGACVVLSDVSTERLQVTEQEFQTVFGRDPVLACSLDVTDGASINKIFQEAALAFGGVDILVNSAGISISKPLEAHTELDWDRLFDILVKGQFFMTQAAVGQMRLQGSGGDIVNIVSKNALVSGPDNAGYGSAKAAQLHLSRLNAAELGKDHIRVNVVNPDAVIADSQIWAGGWAEGRAKAYGITVDQLPEFYARRTLLNQAILPEDIASACFALVGGLLNKSTGNILNVDGGIPAAFVR